MCFQKIVINNFSKVDGRVSESSQSPGRKLLLRVYKKVTQTDTEKEANKKRKEGAEWIVKEEEQKILMRREDKGREEKKRKYQENDKSRSK